MTVETTVIKVAANGNGAATSFSFAPLRIMDDSQLLVVHVDADGLETELTQGTGGSNYSVDVSTYPGTGSVIYPADEVTPMPTGERIVITRVLPLTQLTDLENQGGNFPETQEAVFDRGVMIAQQLQEQLDRCIKTTLGSDSDPNELVESLQQIRTDAAAALTGAQTAQTNAEGFANDASGYADAAAAAVASVELPTAVADTWIRRNSANTAYETKTDSELAALIQSFLFTTGDVKPTLKTTADTGWVMLDDGTIGSASSSATSRANADTSDLFTLLWTNISDTYAAVSGGRGASAAADFAANKTIALPKALGRAFAASGAGSGLTSRALGSTVGAETAVADLAAHTHGVGSLTAASDGAHTHNVALNTDTGGGTGVKVDAVAAETTSVSGVISSDGNHTHTVSGSTGSAGSGGGHANMQPTVFVNYMVKL